MEDSELIAVFIVITIGFVAIVVSSALLSDNQRPRDHPARESPHGADYRTAKVRYIVDGDTVIVVLGFREVTIRLEGIDCPEGDQHWGDTAKYGLIKLIGGRKIRIEERGLDKFGRTVATIFVLQRGGTEWINVNARMVVLGHAWVSRMLCRNLPQNRRAELFRMQKWARSKKVGLWGTENPTPPWEHRHGPD